MNRTEFLFALTEGLSGLPRDEVEDRLTFYNEMIDDRMEEGLTEEAAVAELGTMEEIVAQIVSDIPLTKLVKGKIKPKKRLAVWEIILLILGSPVWLSLLIAAVAVLLSLYVVLWSVIISLWAVFVSLIAGAVGGITSGTVFAFSSHELTGCAMLATGIVCAGLSIFLFFGCKAATKGILLLTKKITLGIKRRFIGKEKAA